MRKRIFKADRLYQILKVVVNVATAFTLSFGVLGFLRGDEISIKYLDKFDNCKRDGGDMTTCGIYLDMMSDKEELTNKYLMVGVGLPIAFYGGTWLVKYLFPKSDEE